MDIMPYQSRNPAKTKEYTKHLPSGFVTYDEMKARFEEKKTMVNISNQREIVKSKTALERTNDNAATGQRFCASKASSNDTSTKGYILYLPKGFVTLKEMEERMAEKKNSAIYRKDKQYHKCNENEEEAIALKECCGSSCIKANEIDSKLDTRFKDYEFHLPKGFVTLREMEERMAEKRKSAIYRKDYTENGRWDVRNGAFAVENEENDVGNSGGNVVKNGDTFLEGSREIIYFRGKSAPFKIIIMNADGSSDEFDAVPERRRHAIQAVISKYSPTLLLFQEFKWKDIRGKIWKACPIPDQYHYSGHSEASMIYDERFVVVDDLGTITRRILEDLQRSSSNQLKAAFPLEFNPLPRMCAKLLHSRFEPSFSFICISWHGIYKGIDKKNYFRYLLEFIRNIHMKMKVPILVGGDFNIAMKYIREYVSKPFKLYKYTASERRDKKGLIDFFITTDELHLSGTRSIDLEALYPDIHPNGILDHDPVYALLSKDKDNE